MEFCSFCYHPHIRWIILIPFVISIQKQYPSIGQCCHREISLCAERQLACGNLPFDTGTPQVIAKDSLSAENYKVTVPPRTYTVIEAAVTVEKKRSDIPYTTIAPVQEDVAGFDAFIEKYKSTLPAEKAAVEGLK